MASDDIDIANSGENQWIFQYRYMIPSLSAGHLLRCKNCFTGTKAIDRKACASNYQGLSAVVKDQMKLIFLLLALYYAYRHCII